IDSTSTLSGGLTMTGGGLAASGSGTTVTASGTTTMSGTSLTAQGGATLALPQLTAYTSTGNNHFIANGTGSVLNVSALTHWTEQDYWVIQAVNGGTIDLSGLSGTLTSTHLSSISDTGGSTLLDGHVTGLTGFGVTLDGSDAHVADSWTKV